MMNILEGHFRYIENNFSKPQLVSGGVLGVLSSPFQLSVKCKHDAHMKASLVHTRTRDVTYLPSRSEVIRPANKPT